MLKRVFFGLLSALIVSAFVSPVLAQAPPPPEVALVDVVYIYKNHPAYNSLRTELQSAVDLAELDVKKRRELLKGMMERLSKLKSDTPDYVALEQAIAKDQSDLNVSVQLQRKRFIEQEARMLHDVYQEILDEVTVYCQRNHIRLAMRKSPDEGKGESAEQIVGLINRPIIYHDPAIDITQVILEQIQRKARPGAATARPAAPTTTNVPRTR
ncbi:MAG: OmpH family outer membrane protein [Planctomycetia bacterium]|nr:OmpH family outer membrane protein [Planctomycetia bacterium]